MTVRLPAAKALIVACGVAGCTGGPGIQTAEHESASPVAVVEAEAVDTGESVAETKMPSLRDRWRQAFKQPAWMRRLVKKQEPAPPDPFVLAHEAQLQRTAEPMVDYTPVVIRPVSYRDADLGWSRDTIRLDRPTPAWFTNGTPSDATPVNAQGERNRNPFASGEANPFVEQPEVRQTSAVARPVPQTQTITPAQNHEQTESITSFLRRQDPIPRGVVHGDMIIDSYLVQPRLNRRVRPISAEIEHHEPIGQRETLPRRPFGEPDWTESESQPTASANQPVSVTPEIPRPAERVSFSSYRSRGEPTPAFSGSAAFRDVEIDENPFADVQGKSAGPIGGEGAAATVVSDNMETRQPVMANRPEISDAVMSVAEVEDEMVFPLASALDLDEAKRLAQERSRGSASTQFGTPLAVGIGLAAVAAGVVMIRGRLA